MVPAARKLDKITFEEMLEMASLGAKVLQIRSVEFASKYNVCFYVIGAPQDNLARKRLTDLAKANACSRVIPFSAFVENPEYTTGALYTVKATERIVTSSESRIVGASLARP